MEKKTKLITKIILGSVITLMTGYFIYEASVNQNASLMYKMTHIKLNEPINSGAVDDLKVVLNPTKVNPTDEEYFFDYQFEPINAGNQEVTVTSNNEDLIQIVDNHHFKVKNFDRNTVNYSKPVTITITSKENKEASDSFDVSILRVPCNYLYFTEYNLPIREIIAPNYFEYTIDTNVLFGLDIKGYESDAISSKETTDEIIIQTSDNITRVSDYEYYINKKDGKQTYIKATSNHQQVSFKFNVENERTLINPTSYKIYKDGSEVTSSLLVNEEYEVRPFNEEYNKDLPFYISSSSSNIKITSGNKFKVLDEGKFTLDFNVPGYDKTSKNYEAVHVFNGFNIDFSYAHSLKNHDIVAYQNHSFQYEFDYLNSTYKDIKIEAKDPNIIEVRDGYIYCKDVGETSLIIKPNDESLVNEDNIITYNLKVKPQRTELILNENIIFSILYLIYGILIGVFIFLFIMNKKYLRYMPISYLAGLVLLSLITLVQLSSKFRYPTFGLFSLYYLMIVIGVSLIYIGITVYHSYNGYDLKDKDNGNN